MSDRNSIRQELLRKRKALAPSERARLSREIGSRFLAALRGISLSGKLIGLYQALPEELDLRHLSDELSAAGARLCYPRIADKEARTMVFAVADQSAASWKKGPYGLLEPHPDTPSVDGKKIELVVVPGVGFGPQGERMGYGAGYYDRFLSRNPELLKVALAFDIQIHPGLPQGAWDQKMDWVMTESRDFRDTRAAQWLVRKLS